MALRALIGLGNSEKEYEHTYHNIGAWSLEYFKQFAQVDGLADRLTFKEPEGFMNNSGAVVKKWLNYNNLTAQDVIIVHDESDLEVGTYKLVRGGGSAGHNGVQSVIDHLGTEDFWRLRIGIRSPNDQVRKKALDFVLERFPDSLEPVFQDVFKKAWLDLKTLFI